MKMLICKECGALVEVIENCKCEKCSIICCDKPMEKVVPNSAFASPEKHLPKYEIKDGIVYVRVNHVMDEDHFISWIKVQGENTELTTYFKPGEEAILTFKYEKDSVIYSYCNKHGLWETKVE